MSQQLRPFAPLSLAPMAEKPLASVLMSNYNYGRYVGEAIESVLAQTYSRLELVICEDGSTDQSCDVIGEYQQRDSRVTLIRKANGGQASGYNAAFAASRGEVICFLDSDDVYLPAKLERIVEAFCANPEAGALGHKLIRVNERRRPIGLAPLLARMPTGWQGDYMLRNAGFLEYMAPGGGLSLRREIARRIFPLPETGPLSHYGDVPLMRLAPLMTNLVAIEEGLAEWRCHSSNFGNSRVVRAEYLQSELTVYHEFWQVQRAHLERHYGLDVARKLAPLDTNLAVLQTEYILARLTKTRVSSAWRMLMRQQRTSNRGTRYLDWFWFPSILLPQELFSLFINLLLFPNGLKTALSRLVSSTFRKSHFRFPSV
jgi:glycosyltransferase involved in cell wall biosynthesis